MILLATAQPDIMVLDLMMEHFDSGFRLSHQIRSNARFKDVPLVMLSGVASATGRRFDQEAEGLKKWSKLDAFLDKPVTARQLLKVIEEKTGAAASGH
jgi:CheY-like chemotaxis protein